MTRDDDTSAGTRSTGGTVSPDGTRRQYLAAVGAGTAGLLAGCSGDGGSGGTVLTNVPSGPCQEPDRGTPTPYDGTFAVESDTTIGGEGDVVGVDRSLYVAHGSTLTIEPGTTLEFATGTQLEVAGTLEASGSCSAPIFLTGQSDERGAWDGVTFTGEASGTLDHVLVANGGTSGGAGVAIRSAGPVSVTNSEIRGSRNFGVSIDRRARLETFSGNGVTGNAEPVEVTAENVSAIAGDNALTGNDTDRLFVWASIDYVVPAEESHTWVNPGIPLYLKQNRNTFEVRGDLTLEPGIELRVAQGNGIFVTGSLNAAIPEGDLPSEGAIESPPENAITIRGARATAGFWEGLKYAETKDENNVLRGVVVRHGGGEPAGRGMYQEPAGVSVLTGSRLTLDGAAIEDNGGYGLFVNKENELQPVERTRIRNNADSAQVFFTTVPALDTSTDYTGNETDRIEVVTPTNAIETSLTVPAVNVPYRFSRSQVDALLRIVADVTIADGTEIHFGQDAGIDVDHGGSLTIEGSEADDGGRSTVLRGEEGTPGYWKGIRYINTRSQDNVVDGAEIRHTGSSNWANIAPPSKAAVAAAYAGEATVRNSLIAEFDGVAFETSDDRAPTGDQTSTLTTSNNVVR